MEATATTRRNDGYPKCMIATEPADPRIGQQCMADDSALHAHADLPAASRRTAATADAAIDPEQCARQYAPLVKQIARYVSRAMPRSVDLNDLIQLGMMGLLEAAKRYNRVASASFATFAAKRIRGAILDGLRRGDSTPRRTRDQLRRIDTAICKLEQALKRRPRATEIARELGWPLTKYLDVLHRAHERQCVYLEDVTETVQPDTYRGVHAADPLDRLMAEDTATALQTQIEHLPERERKVVELYYFNELKLREIGVMLGLSEARVCQLLRKAVDALRAGLLPKCTLAA